MTDKPAIEARNLTKIYYSNFRRRAHPVLSGLSFSVANKETFGLLGINGVGKTTTLKLLLGLLRPSAGEAFVLGWRAGDVRTLAYLGFLPEEPYFYSHLTGYELLDFAGQAFGQPPRQRHDLSRQLLEMVSMTEAASYPLRKYSKGMLQRLGIAQALINNPSVLFLDEPMSGLDPIGRRDLRQILLKLKESGKTIFLNSHLLPDVNELCDRVGVLHGGTLVAEKQIGGSGKGSYQELEDFFLEAVSSAELHKGKKAASVA